jgi:ribosome recycling factor
MVSEVLKQLDARIDKAIEAFQRDLTKVRTGRANATMLDGVRVDYYGTPTPLNQIGTVSVPEARLIIVKPWEKNMLKPIEKAVREAGLNLNPASDSDVVRIPIPALTEERRKLLVKEIKQITEDAKVAVRKHRREANEELDKGEKAGSVPKDDAAAAKKKVDAAIEKSTKNIDVIFDKKQKEILEV